MAIATRETKIWEALRLHMVSVGALVGLPVSYPAEDYSPDVANGFLICSHLPNINVREYMGTEETHTYNGILQVDVMLPLRVNIMSRSVQVAGEVVSLFQEDAPMTFDGVTVRVSKRGDIAQGYRDNGMWRTPISIRWQCFA